MGVDVQILVEHTLPPGIGGNALNRILRPCLDVIRQDDEFWRPHRRHSRPLKGDPDDFIWLAKSVDQEDACFLEVEGPWGISFDVGTHLILASTVLRWNRLIHDPSTQNAIVRLFRTFTGCVGGHRWMCYPDSSYRHMWVSGSLYEGENMDQALLWLNTHCGPPASSISAIATWLTDEEMRRDYPGWDGGEESRMSRDDGYWVDTLTGSD